MLTITKTIVCFAVAAPLLISSALAQAPAQPPVKAQTPAQAPATAPAVTQPADIVDTAVKAGSFTTLVKAVQAAGLVDTLKGKGPFTVLAPTDAAFAKLPAATLDKLLKPENNKLLQSILTFHVLPGEYSAARLTKARAKVFGVKSAEGSAVQFDIRKGVKASGATVTQTDIQTSNGIIHVIDTVMLPASAKRALAGKPARKH